MRDTFVRTILDMARKDPRILIVTGDLGFGVLKPFWQALPHQILNAGIAEQNMTSVAAGLALEGKIVFTYSIGNFPTMRCLEQIRNDCAYHGANVKIVCIGGGFVYGSLGVSHHATEDLAVMRALPDVKVFAPGDLMEAEAVTRALVDIPGTCYLRLGRGGEKRIHSAMPDFSLGKALHIQSGERVAIFSTGAIFDEVSEAAKMLEEKGIHPGLWTFPTLKPIDRECILQCAKEYDHIITCEEHNVIGGFGSAVAEVLSELPRHAELRCLGLRDTYGRLVGSQSYLRAQYGIDASGIAKAVLGFLQEEVRQGL